MNNENLEAWNYFKPNIKQEIIEEEKRALEEKKIKDHSWIVLIFNIVIFGGFYMIYKSYKKFTKKDIDEE